MSAAAFDGLAAAMGEVLDFYKGERGGFAVHSGQDIKAIRRKTRLSQPEFARVYHLEVSSLRDWEQGRRQPERPAQVLLTLIDKDPEGIQRLLAG
jgi:putative transcriptional regulator